jgi:signal transduction histidine kinase
MAMMRSILTYVLLAALAYGGLMTWRYTMAQNDNAVLEASVVSLTASLVVAEKHAAQTKAAWKAAAAAAAAMHQSRRELSDLRANLLKGNFDALPLDPALRAVLDSLRERRNRAAIGRGQDGSP